MYVVIFWYLFYVDIFSLKKMNFFQVLFDLIFESIYKDFDDCCYFCIENIGYLKKFVFLQKIVVWILKYLFLLGKFKCYYYV